MDQNEVIVSVCCITYNHSPYIRQCLDGFMMQQTNFAFEVLIHDDASTDGTTEIIKEYEAKYPEIIKPIYEEENQWVKGRRGSAVFNFPRAKGKYIAMCEGDDYWTDPLKLQKQVDFLESHLDYSMSFHKVLVIYEDGVGQDIFDHLSCREYSIHDIISKWSVPTCSILFRQIIIEKIPKNKNFKYGDNVLVLSCLSMGKIYCLKDIMGTYRRHVGGWTMNKTQIELCRNQFLHFQALIDSFPMLDLSGLYESIFSYACYLATFDDYRNDEIWPLVFRQLKRQPLRFIYTCLKLKIKSIVDKYN